MNNHEKVWHLYHHILKKKLEYTQHNLGTADAYKIVLYEPGEPLHRIILWTHE